ncbi:Nitroreductase [Plectosphaerella plurivora]|uniref:Nitroreductase n=1 Tax=Plectosphaerella plurivora TaxID=936078 RepID=A0A9P9A502_9PEZI|nr:Nitroreductase [Plectosphaerella plurivora]
MSNTLKLLEGRYGGTAHPTSLPHELSNETTRTILQHKSVRRFLPEKLDPGTLELLIAAAQSAASSSNLQAWSVVAIEDPARKDKAALLCGDQDFIRNAPLFLVFCADLDRLTSVSAQHQKPAEALQYLELVLLASGDAMLAAQNATIAAESLGLGACYVGGARNNPRELANLLGLPPRVVGLVGLAVGKPDPAVPGSVKPRLPQAEVLHRETWSNEGQEEHFKEYDQTLQDFNVGQGRVAETWTGRAADRVATVASMHGRHIWSEVLRERNLEIK